MTYSINASSTKDEIISHSCELVDGQADQIEELKLQRKYLIFAVVLLFTLLQF